MNTVKVDSLTYLIRTARAASDLKRTIVEIAHFDSKYHTALKRQNENKNSKTEKKQYDIKNDFNPREVERLVDR